MEEERCAAKEAELVLPKVLIFLFTAACCAPSTFGLNLLPAGTFDRRGAPRS
jgi:hypothetical protein